jgi:S1-C subfamily serine protease
VATAIRRWLPFLLAALLGAGIAIGVGAAAWHGGTTTVVRVERASSEPANFANQTGKTVDDIYKEAAPGVVQVTSTSVVASNPFFGTQEQEALGSGFVIDKAGHIITNYHVVEGAKKVEVSFSSNDHIKARVVGSDPSTDIAVLKIDAKARALTPLPLGDSDTVRVGDAVVAIGNPFGLARTATAGIVSALQREIQAPNNFVIDKVIQTDAAINHGNSGGPLLNARGEVIGVNSQIETGGTGGGNVGIGFAIPINTVSDIVSQLIAHGKVDHAFLGIEMQPIDSSLTQTFRLPADHGVLITRVIPGSPAAHAGLKAGTHQVVVDGTTYVVGGDVITKADGKAVTDPDQLGALVRSKKPGDEITLEVHRDSETKDVNVKLGRQPRSSG